MSEVLTSVPGEVSVLHCVIAVLAVCARPPFIGNPSAIDLAPLTARTAAGQS